MFKDPMVLSSEHQNYNFLAEISRKYVTYLFQNIPKYRIKRTEIFPEEKLCPLQMNLDVNKLILSC